MLKNPSFWALVTFLVGTGLQLGGYQNAYIAWACIVATAVLLAYGAVPFFALPGTYWMRVGALWSLRFGGTIALPRAAAIAYEEARANGTLWAHAAEKLAAEKTPDGIIDYVATYFAMKVPIWGVRPPSRRLEKIDGTKAMHGAFAGGAQTLSIADSSGTIFEDMRVASKDVRIVVRSMAQKVFPDGQA